MEKLSALLNSGQARTAFIATHVNPACPLCGGKGLLVKVNKWKVMGIDQEASEEVFCSCVIEGYAKQKREWERERLKENAPLGTNPDCIWCWGGGWVSRQGMAVLCSAPGCAKEGREAMRRGEKVIRSRGVKTEMTFDSIMKVKGIEESLEAAQEWAKGSLCFVVICGGTGNGKTHLAHAAVGEACKRGDDARLFVVADLLADMRRRMGDNSLEDFVAQVKATPFLALDDLGMELQTDWAQARLEEILNYRYANYLFTLITTNLNPDSLSERLKSRFSDPSVCRLVLNTASDYRRR